MEQYVGSVVAALAAGAIAKLGDVGGKAVLDSYEALKKLVADRSKRGRAVDALEEDPHSETQRKVVEEALAQSAPEPDSDLTRAAASLTAELEKCPPASLEAVGLHLRSVEATNLRLRRISVHGSGVGARIEDANVKTIAVDEVAVRNPNHPK